MFIGRFRVYLHYFTAWGPHLAKTKACESFGRYMKFGESRLLKGDYQQDLRTGYSFNTNLLEAEFQT